MEEKNTLDSPYISVVIATYRRDKSLENTLQSLVNQTHKKFDVVVVDDNADFYWNSKVKNIIDQFESKLALKYIINKENKGSAETRNIGIEACSGDFVTFLDDDDVYLPKKIENQVNHMIKEGSDFSITDLDLYDEKGKLVEKRRRDYLKNKKEKDLLELHLMHHITGTDTMMFKKEYLLSIGCFSKIDVGDEFYLMLKAFEKKGTFSYLPVSDVHALVHSQTDGLSSGNSKIEGENALFDYKKRYFNQLSNKTKKYITMRHYAVLGFAEYRRRNYFAFLKNSLISLFSSPIDCLDLLLNRY